MNQMAPIDRTGQQVFVGCFVCVRSLPVENYGKPIETIRQQALGRICQVISPHEGTSDNGIQIRTGEFLLAFAALSRVGLGSIGFYARPQDIEIVTATEEMVLLYSPDIWQLLRPFGEVQDTSTFHKLKAVFGLVQEER